MPSNYCPLSPVDERSPSHVRLPCTIAEESEIRSLTSGAPSEGISKGSAGGEKVIKPSAVHLPPSTENVRTMVAKAKTVAAQIWVLLHAKHCTQEGDDATPCCPVPNCASTKRLYALSRLHTRQLREGESTRGASAHCVGTTSLNSSKALPRADEKEQEEVDASDDTDLRGSTEGKPASLLTPSQEQAINEAKKLLCHVKVCRDMRLAATHQRPHFCLVCSLVARARMNSSGEARNSGGLGDDSPPTMNFDFSRLPEVDGGGSSVHPENHSKSRHQRRTKQRARSGSDSWNSRTKNRSQSLGSFADEALNDSVKPPLKPLVATGTSPSALPQGPTSPQAEAAAASMRLMMMGGTQEAQAGEEASSTLQRRRSLSLADAWAPSGGRVEDGRPCEGGESKRARSLSFSELGNTDEVAPLQRRRCRSGSDMSAEDEEAAQLLSILGGESSGGRTRSSSVSSVASITSEEDFRSPTLSGGEVPTLGVSESSSLLTSDVVAGGGGPIKRPRSVSWGKDEWKCDDAADVAGGGGSDSTGCQGGGGVISPELTSPSSPSGGAGTKGTSGGYGVSQGAKGLATPPESAEPGASRPVAVPFPAPATRALKGILRRSPPLLAAGNNKTNKDDSSRASVATAAEVDLMKLAEAAQQHTWPTAR